MFLDKRNFKVKTLKMCKVISQGLLMSPEDFGWTVEKQNDENIIFTGKAQHPGEEYFKVGDFLTAELGITYADAADNKRKANSVDKYQKMTQRMGKKFAKQPYKWLMKHKLGRKILYLFFGNNKKDNAKAWPDGKFPGVTRTDQERAENMTWILQDKTPFIVTQKCDGSSGTYILERKGKNKFEFYVCSRNVRMASKEQECFYGSHNYYWEVAEKYDIENKMKAWLNSVPGRDWVCWQGEICAPDIQKNPHNLSETHFYCFHWTDNVNGRRDIRDAIVDWKSYNMETVPIVCDNYIMPDDFEEFKKSADGYYMEEVCEGHTNCKREGFVYYKTTEPTFSFKNVSREYLLNH